MLSKMGKIEASDHQSTEGGVHNKVSSIIIRLCYSNTDALRPPQWTMMLSKMGKTEVSDHQSAEGGGSQQGLIDHHCIKGQDN